jgi:phosphoglycolate phosphatase-like HAD superfamily hydrolase
MASFAVFDIDGVLADVGHRLHHLRGRPKNWDAFFAAAAADPVLPTGKARVLAAAEQHAIVYLSGRPERLRTLTQRWLHQHGFPVGVLVLRGGRDRRPARVVKPELVAQVATAGPIALVVDDDPDVCAALRARGYPVEQAAWAQASEDLRAAQEREGRT